MSVKFVVGSFYSFLGGFYLAKIIPDHIDPSCLSPGEKDLFEAFHGDQGTDDWIVIHSLDIAHHSRQIAGEIDFLLLVPGMGVLCIEVKGCRGLYRKEGAWYYGTNPRPDYRGPFAQAKNAMHSVRKKVMEKYPFMEVVPFFSAVMFPYIEFDQSSDEWLPWQAIDSQAFLSKPVGELFEEVLAKARFHLSTCDTAKWFKPDKGLPTKQQCELIASHLRPDFEFYESPKIRIRKTYSDLKRFTGEQFVALDAMSCNDRVIFDGLAGTGKTMLAIESARRFASQGKKTLFLCFNRLLSQRLLSETEPLSELVRASTFHKYLLEIARVNKIESSSEFWERKLPNEALNALLSQEGVNGTYDALVIDEAQDLLKPSIIDVLDLSVKGGLKEGHWRLFGDFSHQDIFSSPDASVKDLLEKHFGTVPRYQLRVNCRNAPRISRLAEQTLGMEGAYSRVLRDEIESPFLSVSYSSEEEQKLMLMKVLEDLYKEGFRPQDMVILSNSAHSGCACKIDKSPWKERIRPIYEIEENSGYIPYTTIQAFKGMEAPVVIVTDVTKDLNEEQPELLYVGITRSITRLCIFQKK